jgi:hypothetical protein
MRWQAFADNDEHYERHLNKKYGRPSMELTFFIKIH